MVTASDDDIREIAASIWETMFHSGLTPATATAFDGEPVVTGCVHIDGAWHGAVTLQCGDQLAGLLAAELFLADAPTKEQVWDTIGELTNMLAGNIKALLPEPSWISLPAVAFGSDYALSVMGAAPVAVVPLRSNDLPLVVTLLQRREPASEPWGEERRRRDRVHVASILVVDDSSTIRRILRRDLESVGYRVSEAPDGQQGLVACRAMQPDLVLLDVDMPIMDGMATLEAMKADPALRQLPVLFLTAQTSGAEAARGLLLGAHDYLKKPCAKAELLARVSAALRQTAHEQKLTSHAQELAELSTTDPLTGVGNRRHLEQGLALLPKSRPLGVLMADLDRFKQVNDTRGHVVGDAVLAIVAARLRAGCGPEAIIARWGGEEFVIAVPDATSESLSELGERLRAAVANDPLVVGDVEPLQVTISIGGATGRAGEFVALLGVADTALYDAKDAGRNQVRTSTLPAR